MRGAGRSQPETGSERKGGGRQQLRMLTGRKSGGPGPVAPPPPRTPGPRQPPGAPAPRSPPAPLRPGVMDGLAQNGLGANPQSAACWAQLDQQQASWYFWINTNKSSFSSRQAVLPLPAPAPRLFSSPAGRGEREER